MHKIITISALAAILSLPAFAEIANNATCNNTNLGQSDNNSTANVEANWNANTININWYNGNTKITSNTCTYDGSITLPTQPTKPGYIFAGWKLRTTTPTTPSDCISYYGNQSACNADKNCIVLDDDNGLNCYNNNTYCQTINDYQTCDDTPGCLWALDGDTNTYGCYNENPSYYIYNGGPEVCNKSAMGCMDFTSVKLKWADYGCEPTADCPIGGSN